MVHPKRFTIMWGGLSSTTTSVQHPLGWCDGCHRTTAPVRSPHTSYRWRGEREIEPIKWILHQIVSITKLNSTKMLWIYLTKQIKLSGEFILIFVMKFIGSSKQNNYWSTLNNANKENEKQLKSIHFFKKITFAYSWIKPKYHDDVYILNISLLLQKNIYIYIQYLTGLTPMQFV